MRKIFWPFLVAAFTFTVVPLAAQVTYPSVVNSATDPTGKACANGAPIFWHAGIYYGCDATGHYVAMPTGLSSGSVSGQADGFIPLATGVNDIGAQSPIDYGVTTANTVTSSKPLVDGPNPSTFTNWTEMGFSQPNVITASRADNAADLFPAVAPCYYQITDTSTAYASDSAATCVVGSTDWIRNGAVSGLNEAFGLAGQVFVHGDGNGTTGHAYGVTGQNFIDGSVGTSSALFVLSYPHYNGGVNPIEVGTMNGIEVNQGTGPDETYQNLYGVNIENPSLGNGETIVNSTGLYIGNYGDYGTNGYQLISSGIAPSRFAGPVRSPLFTSLGTQNVTGCSLSSAVGGASAGSFHSGTTGTCTVTITPGFTAATGFSCWTNDMTTPADHIPQTAYNSTTATVSGTTVSGDVITWGCMGF